jgi:predicted MPP superfamily phosphohydrolase
MKDAIPPMVTSDRRAPIPVGLLSGRRTRLRRWAAYLAAALNRTIDLLPVGRWLHRRIQRELALSQHEFHLRPGAEGLAGLRIAFLTDLHAGSFMDQQDLVRIFKRVAAAKPHLVLLGGDLINTRDRELLLFRAALRELRPQLGMFAVPGNHDHFWGSDIGLWMAFLQQHGVQVLRNRGVRLQWNDTSLWLCGVDDLTEGEPDLRRALEGRFVGEPTVLLSHHPDFFFEAAAAEVDLTLSGHTHGGQIRVGGRAPLHHSKFGYEQGWFSEGQARLYVSRGVGVTVLPIRIDAPPEVPIVTFVVRKATPPVEAAQSVAQSASASARVEAAAAPPAEPAVPVGAAGS